MKEKKFIASNQFTALVFIFSIGSTVVITPPFLILFAKQSLWIAGVGAIIVGGGFAWLFGKIVEKNPEMTLIEMLKATFGPYIGGFIGFVYLLYMFLLATFLLNNISNFMAIQIMPETPINWTQGLMILAVMYALFLGIEVVARTAEIFLPWIVIPFILLILLNIPQMKLQQMLPLYDYNLDGVIQSAAYFVVNPYLELIFLLMITPHLKRVKEVKKGLLIGSALAGASITILSVACILALGIDVASINLYPTYLLGKLISFGSFIQHIEVLVAIIWMLSIFFKISIIFYGLQKGLAQLFQLRNERFLIVPLGLLISGAAYYMVPDYAYFAEFLVQEWSIYMVILGAIFPMLLFVFLRIQQKVHEMI
ncbi:GerAB/ArcD/ProY family transporter [Priestia koreensis]|uniref:GerAB/ArcD/ProY family transporter n=1 Tax=Priestia koreensis TaxID=284581 RepID=UPI001F5AEBE0|nr:endospore germination permease [Priestia koreensis]MCM3003073.1 endospore germination permease [Priestia koreensis]UNL85885.1 endospore germination permease [Priestia koreensis]